MLHLPLHACQQSSVDCLLWLGRLLLSLLLMRAALVSHDQEELQALQRVRMERAVLEGTAFKGRCGPCMLASTNPAILAA